MEEKTPTIALIMPYFGKWPGWIDYFFESCSYNSSIDFYFFTDCPLPKTEHPNMHFTEISFDDYCMMVSNKLGIDFHPSCARKLCDVKPFYAMVHKEILEKGKYDFWGYGDMDLILGDIRLFYTNELLSQYDVLSTHADRLSGHLTLLRNRPDLNASCLRIKGWKNLLESKDNHTVDEELFSLLFLPWAKILWKLHKYIWLKHCDLYKDEFASYNNFCHRINRLLGLGRRRVYMHEQYTTPWFTPNHDTMYESYEWEYQNGHIFEQPTGNELIYLHFLALKHRWSLSDFPKSSNIIINAEGIKAK